MNALVLGTVSLVAGLYFHSLIRKGNAWLSKCAKGLKELTESLQKEKKGSITQEKIERYQSILQALDRKAREALAYSFLGFAGYTLLATLIVFFFLSV